MALERLDARARLVGHRVRRRHDEVAVRALLGAADAPAQLVELREAEHVGAIDDDGVGARDVEAALDDGRGDEHVVAALDEVEHRLLERAPRAIWPCADRDARLGHQRLQARGALVDALDAVVDVEDLAAAGELARDRLRAAPRRRCA